MRHRDTVDEAVEQARLRRRLPTPAARRALRERAGVSQQAIGDAVGVSRAEVSKWESGTRSPRAGETLQRYLDVLDRLTREALAQ